ncbi:MAG: hypothetical protein HQK68_06655 [Desulfamplus sp.]|nr:hypothetical protein [Desulfamplus sp.]
MKIYRRLWSIFVVALTIFSPFLSEAKTLEPNQQTVTLSQMDAESLILTINPNEAFTVSPTLTIPKEDQGSIVKLFAIALHSDWALLMDKSGWKPYSGEITLFGEITLSEILQPFTFDGGKLIKNLGESIDIFYGYEVVKSSFFGNAIHFQRAAEEEGDLSTFEYCIEHDIFKINQESVDLLTLNADELLLVSLSDNCGSVSPSIKVLDADVGKVAQVFAAILVEDYIIVKTPSGWDFYNYDKEFLPFQITTLDKELTGFELPVPADYYGEVFYYYAYFITRTDMRGNAMRVNVATDK